MCCLAEAALSRDILVKPETKSDLAPSLMSSMERCKKKSDISKLIPNVLLKKHARNY
jgi:hypothetical protein